MQGGGVSTPSPPVNRNTMEGGLLCEQRVLLRDLVKTTWHILNRPSPLDYDK